MATEKDQTGATEQLLASNCHAKSPKNEKKPNQVTQCIGKRKDQQLHHTDEGKKDI